MPAAFSGLDGVVDALAGVGVGERRGRGGDLRQVGATVEVRRAADRPDGGQFAGRDLRASTPRSASAHRPPSVPVSWTPRSRTAVSAVVPGLAVELLGAHAEAEHLLAGQVHGTRSRCAVWPSVEQRRQSSSASAGGRGWRGRRPTGGRAAPRCPLPGRGRPPRGRGGLILVRLASSEGRQALCPRLARAARLYLLEDGGHRVHPAPAIETRAPATGKAIDIPHNFVLSWSYQLPVGSGRRFLSDASGVVQMLVEGWSVNGITMYQSGQPLNIRLASSQLNTGY